MAMPDQSLNKLSIRKRAICLGYASFVEAKQSNFRRWFKQLEKDIDSLSKNLTENSDRPVLQHALIDLLDYLDPDCICFTKQYCSKV